MICIHAKNQASVGWFVIPFVCHVWGDSTGTDFAGIDPAIALFSSGLDLGSLNRDRQDSSLHGTQFCLYCSDANADEVRWDRGSCPGCYGAGGLAHLFVAWIVGLRVKIGLIRSFHQSCAGPTLSW